MSLQKTIDLMYAGLNRVRCQPQSQAVYYQNSKSLQNVKTRQGVNALQNLCTQLKQRQPIPRRLKWSFALHMAADEQAIRLGDNGLTTTDGTRFHTPLPERCKQFGVVRGRLTEVYEFGGNSAQQILQCLLVDDGLVSRKRRKTLLDPIYSYVGIGTSYHQKYGTVTVIILAQDIISLVTPGDEGIYYRRQTVPQGQVYTFDIEQQRQNQRRRIMEQRSRNDSYYSHSNSFESGYGYRPSSPTRNRLQNQDRYRPSSPQRVQHQNALRSNQQIQGSRKKDESSCQIF